MPDNIVLRPFDVDEEPEPSSEAYYHILSDAIQPDTKTTTETTVDQIVKYIPKDGTSETLNFLDLCFDVSEQIHYNHPSQSKLVTIMDLVLKDPKVVSPRGDAEQDRLARCTLLFQTVRDRWNSSKPSRGAALYVNVQSFAAQIYERGMLTPTTLAMYTCDDALDTPKTPKSPDELEAYIKAASQWLLLLGPRIYNEVLNRPKKENASYPSPKQWRQWRDELEAAASQKPGKKYVDLSEEARTLAGKVVEEMKAIERKAGR